MTSKTNSYAYLSYFILAIFIFLILFFPSIVNAATLTSRSALDGYATNNVFDTTGIVDSDQRPQENFTYSSTLNTTYSRKLYGLRAYFNYSLTANHTYRLSINTSLSNFNWSAFNYANLSVCFGSSWSGANSNCSSNVGYSILSADTIAFNFRPTSNYTYFSFRIGPQTMSEYPLTTSYSYRITSFVLDDLNAVPSNPSNNDVINNANQNTTTILDEINDSTVFIDGRITTARDEIINFNRQAEHNIINNNNQNTQDIIDNFNSNLNTCNQINRTIDINDSDPNLTGRNLESDGSISVSASYNISNYIEILPSATYSLTASSSGPNAVYFCIYSDNKTVLQCIRYGGASYWSFVAPDNAKYIRLSINTGTGYTLTLISSEVCTNKLDDIKDSIDGISGYISDGNVSSSTGQNFFGNFQVDDFGISGIITAPLNAINSLTSATCSPLIIPIPFTNSTVSLPCMSSYYSSKVPELYQLWQIVSFGILSYYIINSIFGMIHNFREPDNDCVEVLDL